MDLIYSNLFSLFVNIYSISNYLYLQYSKNIFKYTIFCLINSILFFVRGILFKDYSGAFCEFFWVSVSVYGIIKNRK